MACFIELTFCRLASSQPMVFEGTETSTFSHFRKGTIHIKSKMDWHSSRERATHQFLKC